MGTCSGSAPPVSDSVGSGGVPGEPNKEGSVVSVVRRPPFLRVGHKYRKVLFYCGQVKGHELLSVVVVVAHRAHLLVVLAQDIEFHALGPPIFVGFSASGGCNNSVAGVGAFC